MTYKPNTKHKKSFKPTVSSSHHKPVQVPVVEQRKKQVNVSQMVAYSKLHGGFEVRTYKQPITNILEWNLSGVFGIHNVIFETGKANTVEETFKLAEQRYKKLKIEHGY